MIRHRVEEVVSVFENSSLTLQYDYIEALGDGRGYTAGRMGATTGTGDLLQTVEVYLNENPRSELRSLLPVLRLRASQESASIKGLEALPRMWRHAAKDPVFRKVQDDLESKLIFMPSVEIARQQKVESALAFLCIYDTQVQHGQEELEEILANLRASHASEADWIREFLEKRFEWLYFPGERSTQKEWRASRGRIFTLLALLKEQNYQLNGPFQIRPFDQTFIIR